jgi:glycosyltransferase involved in cell wall biosynthesis
VSASKERPRVALVHDWLTGMRGGEFVLAAIAEQFPEAPIYTLFHFPGTVSAAIERHPIETSYLSRAPLLRTRYRSYLPLFPNAIEALDLSAFDLVISTSHCVAKGIIPAPEAVHVCYCHTPMRYAWDQEHAYFPKRRGLSARLRGVILSQLRTWDVASSARVHTFVANSSFVAQRIRAYYGRESTVIHPPVDVDFFTPGEAKPGPDYALLVSALAPYKRVEVAIGACARLGLELRIVGTGPEKRRLERLGGPGVHFMGTLSREELREAYRGAKLFLQPGIEDFGIAPVEALACGVPVVAAGRGGILDIVEDGRHGILSSPHQGVPAFVEAIDKAVQIGFNRLDLRQCAERFSARCFGEQFHSLLVRCFPELSPLA